MTRLLKDDFFVLIYRVTIIILIIVASSCSNNTSDKSKVNSDSTTSKSKDVDENIWRTCSFSNKDFAYEIDSCNCGDIYTTYDTIYISLYQAAGGEIQGHLLKINFPKCDSSYFILMKHQNRYYFSSMGPDPLLTDWIFYNSQFDTVWYDTKRNGFYIDTIPIIEQRKFPNFDTIDFYKAYERAVGENLNLDYVPNNAKAALYREYSNYKQKAKEVLELSGVELHRIILVLQQGTLKKKVIVLIYGHFG